MTAAKMSPPLAALLILVSTLAAQAAYMPVQNTPYDRQMNRVNSILASTSSQQTSIDMAELTQWMRQIRGFSYRYKQTWQTPEETTRKRSGDCKDKAILLLDRMNKAGFGKVTLVIGYRSQDSDQTHAWLEWSHAGTRYVLDPTFHNKPIQRHDLAENYRPKYAYLGTRSFSYVSNEGLLAGL